MPKQTSRFESTPNPEQARHRALADPTRVRILELLRQATEPLDAQTLAQRLDLHLSTVRSHLKTLAAAGLITTQRQQRNKPGRPRCLYSPSPDATPVADAKSSLLLAQILATAIANNTANPAETAEQAGHAWGKYLTTPPRPNTKLTNQDAANQLAALHEELGFNPTLRRRTNGYDLNLHRCPFHDAATHYPNIVCAAHLGLLHGALTTLHTNLTLTTLTPHAHPSHCRAQFTPLT